MCRMWLPCVLGLAMVAGCGGERRAADEDASAPATRVARPTPSPTPPAEPYRFQPKVDTFESVSHNIEIEESEKGTRMKGLGEGSKIAMAVPFSGGGSPTYMPDAPGSSEIHIVVNEEMGYTTFAGLRFREAVVAGVRKDGLVVADKAGVTAHDSEGRAFVSAETSVDGANLIVMVGPIDE